MTHSQAQSRLNSGTCERYTISPPGQPRQAPHFLAAVYKRQPPPGMIHHSDRGGQYAGNEYRSVLRRAAALPSMSRAGDCYDNAFMESCFGTIKTELEMTDYQSSRQARKEIAQYVLYYDFERRHSGIHYCTPAQFERIINLSE